MCLQLDLIDRLPLVFAGWAMPPERRRLPPRPREAATHLPSLFDAPRRSLVRQQSSQTLPAAQRFTPAPRAVMFLPGASDETRRKVAARYAMQPAGAVPAPLAKSAHVRTIQREVALAYGLTVEELWSPSQSIDAVLPRHEVFYRVRAETGMSFPQIARRCGGYDMTTVFYAVKKTRQRLAGGWRMRTRPDVGAAP